MLMTQHLPPAWGWRTSRGSPWEWEVPSLCQNGAWIQEGRRGLGLCAEEGDDPRGITSLENRWRSPKFWVTALSRVTTVPRALGIRQRESNALCLILFFFLQCKRKEVGSSFVQNTLLPCVQQVLCYRSAAQLHPFARLQQARRGCTALCCTAGKALWDGARD